ncbi:gamma-glutamyltransferase [Aestuariibacter sp. P117]|uniref:Glutathione hydrolase proenzyme n=2 Tax=Glaciecola petra TaxID=3075602 RepID=A0ABU2ZMH5_9ALTE|nr:gamma-glutamyltransferase [Aestuariibacter sp. P117]MDT0593559.1 gamma-glutamyltransferase [Aestuariibacter sp. P117]
MLINKKIKSVSLFSVFFLLVLVIISACSDSSQRDTFDSKKSVQKIENQQAVAMPDEFAANIAMDILNKGGNAVDAAIAAQFSLAVTFPEAGNIGGGGFMLIHYDKQDDFIDYRESAPGLAHRDMYLDENGEVKRLESLFGVLASGTPGTVSGMWEAHKKYGTLPWADLVQPAYTLSKEGFIMPEALASKIKRYIDRLEKREITVNFKDYFGHARTGELFVQAELADTLLRIKEAGKKGFYEGETAKIISRFMEQKGGLINQDDLLKYQAKWRKPIKSKWRQYEVISAAPPSSGGIAVAQWLQMFDIVKARSPELNLNDAQYIHVLAEIGKRVFADRAEYLGDPDFIDVPQKALLTSEYIQERAHSIQLDKISISEDIKPGLAESEQTTHFSIVDAMGNAVSNTTTINLGFGSGVVVEGGGFLLNDEMDDFSAKAGVPNYFGAIGGQANEIQPYKRMLSSMTPTIVLENNEIKMVTGSPGGTTILSSVYLSILHALEFNLPAQQVVDQPRFHHQLLPKNEIRYHEGLSTDVLTELEALGYSTRKSRFGDLHVIIKNKGKLEAASETNGRGKALVQSSTIVQTITEETF